MKTVSSLSFAGGVYKGKDIRVSAVQPSTVNDVLSLDWKKGSPSTISSLSGDGAVLDDLPFVHDADDVGDASDNAEIMCDEQKAHAEPCANAGKQFENLRLHGHVECRGRLIRDQQIRFVR